MENKIEKLKKKSEGDRLRQMYEWVKTDVINLKEFLALMSLLEKEVIKIPASPMNDYDESDYKLVSRIDER